MYTKEEREGILWEFHRSGMGVAGACRRLPLFPKRDNLYRWLRMEEAGELTATEMPGRAARMHCAHGEGSPRYAEARARAAAGRRAMAGETAGGPKQTDWRDWGADLPGDPAERARMAEVKLAEALAVLDVLKAPGPGSLSNEEKYLAGEAARAACPLARLRDVTETLSIPKSTYLDQRAMVGRPDPKAPLRARVRASFEASGGTYGAESVTADLRSGEGEPVSWRELEGAGDDRPVVASEKVVRGIMSEEGLVCRKAEQVMRRAAHNSYRGEISERPGNLPLREDGTHDFTAAGPGRLVVTDVAEFRLGGYKAYLSPAIDCFDGWPVCWRVSLHPDADLMCGMLEDLVAAVGPTEARPLVAHTDGGAVYMGRRWRETCERSHVTRSMSRKAKSPDNARAEGFFGTLKSDFFEARDWSGVGFEEFSAELDGYIEWYRSAKLKKSLGWKTIRQHREELGYAA
ncbi:IS3 family transposase [Paratractidigestivibacter sp.]|uniref:IS3 family transposase n=1 Tax=Paratractidigestivibacter sp. TaxID=2847316 RepID=UPI002AC8B99A|nr:IS3 family transposase [Paratractidigestivibacter sp.]